MPSWFDDEVAALERRTADLRGREGLVLFYGSSSFTLWPDLPEWFPGHAVVNHGFGGSTLADCLEYFDRLVAAMRPSVVLLYAGDNDLDQGTRPEAVLAMVERFIAHKRASLGAVPMAYLSIKVSPARFPIMHTIAYANRIIEARLRDEPEIRFLDVTRLMVERGIEPFRRYYSEDPLHMNREGYRVWAHVLQRYLAQVAAAPQPPRSSAGGPIVDKQ